MNHRAWLQLDSQEAPPRTVDAQQRLRLLMLLFAFACVGIIARACQLEWQHGNAYRAEALKPLRREIVRDR